LTLDKLIADCQKNDRKAQEALYHKYASILFGLCLKYSPNRVEAEDNLQDAFITIFGRIGQYTGKGSFEGWIKRVTVNTVLQKYRKKRVLTLPEDDILEAAEEFTEDEPSLPLSFLLSIIQELPERYRLVFNLYVLDGYTHKEIGELMGISDGTSKSNLARARILLRSKIEAHHKAADNN
jgi:RNA polymerase sigma factor (sigma-70 family)|tara:strand:- start:17972 stop:18511 length:540 start_codon:yes stop_codon:yes gene_type:complete